MACLLFNLIISAVTVKMKNTVYTESPWYLEEIDL